MLMKGRGISPRVNFNIPRRYRGCMYIYNNMEMSTELKFHNNFGPGGPLFSWSIGSPDQVFQDQNLVPASAA